MRLSRRAAELAILALALLLPFETVEPLLSIDGVGFTSVEIALVVLLVLGAIALVADSKRRRELMAAIPPAWVILLGAFALAALVSALAAPALREHALKATGRTWSGLALLVVVTAVVRTRRDLGLVCGALAAGAVSSGLIGLAEMASGHGYRWLSHFRTQETFVGSFRRLTFSSTGLLFWFLCGLWLGATRPSTL